MHASVKHWSVIGTLILVGCEARPLAPPTGAIATPVAATSSTTTPVRSANAAPAADRSAPGIDPSLLKRGFRARQRNGQLKYCRTQVLTGTHFSNTVCYTADEIRVQDANTKTDMDLVKRQGHSPCPNNKCD
jgi:hypothetical protein